MTPARTSAPRRAPEDQAREERRRRARQESLDVRERVDRPYRSFEVRNPVHGTHYRVLAPGTPALLLCPCPDFGRRDVGTCKHVEAVRTYLASGVAPVARPAEARGTTEPLWRTIDGELAGLARDAPAATLLRIWGPGRRLISAGGR